MQRALEIKQKGLGWLFGDAGKEGPFPSLTRFQCFLNNDLLIRSGWDPTLVHHCLCEGKSRLLPDHLGCTRKAVLIKFAGRMGSYKAEQSGWGELYNFSVSASPEDFGEDGMHRRQCD